MQILIVIALVAFSPIKLTAWAIGLLCGNITDGFHRGWDLKNPYGEVE